VAAHSEGPCSNSTISTSTSKTSPAVGLGTEDYAILALVRSERAVHSVHLAFRVGSRAEVERFYATALSAGARSNGAPGLRSHYHAHYYAAFVLDPDGHNLEVVCHLPEVSE